MITFEELQLCGWSTASASRQQLVQVLEASAAHAAGSVRVESCQRVEVYGPTACACDAPIHASGKPALLHFAEVAAGLHSVVLGEAQVLGQARAAIPAAAPELQAVLTPAIAAARALRAETTFGTHTGHLLDRALHLAGIEKPGRVAVIGAGSAGRLVAERARALDASEIVIFGRRTPEGRWFSDGGFLFERLTHMREAGPFDLLVSCLGSTADELDAEHDLPEVTRLIVDLGTPRNIGGTSQVPCISIADMLADEGSWRHTEGRRRELQRRLAVILDERLQMAQEDAATALGRMRLDVERIRRAELERTGRLHPEIDPALVDQITRSLVNQIFHLPSQRLRQLGNDELSGRLAALFAPHPHEEEQSR